MTVDEVHEKLAEAISHCHGTHLLEDVMKDIGEGRLRLWIGERSVGVTEFIQYPRRRVLSMFLFAGDREELQVTLPGLAAFARGGGADAIMFCGRTHGRTAWTKILPQFEHAWDGLWKDIR